MKSQQMAIQKFEKDMETLIKRVSTVAKEEVKMMHMYLQANQEEEKRMMAKASIIQVLRETEVFRELGEEQPRVS